MSHPNSAELNNERIEKAMHDKGLNTFASLAKEMDIPAPTLYRALNGERKPSLLLTLKIMSTLGLELSEVLLPQETNPAAA